MPKSATPRREWLAVVLPPAAALVLLTFGATGASSRTHGWLVLGAALLGGAAPPLVYALVLRQKRRLFLRDAEAIERNRARIGRFGVPVGWALGGLLLLALVTLGRWAEIVISGALGGALLGFWPSLLANFLRLRREVWTR